MKNNLSVQLLYRQNSYNCILSFCNGKLYLEFCENDNLPDGIVYEIGSGLIRTTYCGMESVLELEFADDDFLPVVLYRFFNSVGEVFALCDEKGDGVYSTTKYAGDCIVEFESTNHKDHTAYKISVT